MCIAPLSKRVTVGLPSVTLKDALDRVNSSGRQPSLHQAVCGSLGRQRDPSTPQVYSSTAVWTNHTFYCFCITKAISLGQCTCTYICITRSDWLTDPSPPVKQSDARDGADDTDGPTMHLGSVPGRVNESRQRKCTVVPGVSLLPAP